MFTLSIDCRTTWIRVKKISQNERSSYLKNAILMAGSTAEEKIMAKGQMRGNKEIKKPKKKKEAPTASAGAMKGSPLSIIPATKKKK